MHHLPVGVVPGAHEATSAPAARTMLATTLVVFTTSTATSSVSTGCVVTASVGATATTGYTLPQSTQASLDLGTNSYRSLHVPIEDRLAAIRQRAQAAADALGIETATDHGPLGPPVVPKPSPAAPAPLPQRTARPAKAASSSEEEDRPKDGDWTIASPRRRRRAPTRSVEAMEASSDSTGSSTTGSKMINRMAAGKRKGRDAERRSPPKKSAPSSGRSSSRKGDLQDASSGSGMDASETAW